MSQPESRLWERMRKAFAAWWKRVREHVTAFATWSDKPTGRLVRWTIGTILAVYSIGAGHPLG
jgi:hypothetical protein